LGGNFAILNLDDNDQLRFRYDAKDQNIVVWVHLRSRLYFEQCIRSTEDIKYGGLISIDLSGMKEVSVTDSTVISTPSEDIIVSGFEERKFDYGKCFVARIGSPQLSDEVHPQVTGP
jgi:hypothetical protein